VRSYARAILTVLSIVTVVIVVTGAAPALGQPQDLAAARIATARFHDLAVAEAAGYALFTDAAGVACIDQLPAGAMGIHYVNGDLVGTGAIDAANPQALVYEPLDDRGLRLAAAEYVVLQAVWDASHSSPPTLFGQQFSLTPAGNRYGLPAFYSLHAWLWKDNPSGLFSMWNPRVICDATDVAPQNQVKHNH
jgi:hypothetical protein